MGKDTDDHDPQDEPDGQAPIGEEHGNDFLQQRRKNGHEACPWISALAALRARATRIRAAASNDAAMTRMKKSPPGQAMATPSPSQNSPKAEISTPTPNFSKFSGTSESGRRR